MEKRIINFLASAGLIITAAIWGFAFVVVKDSLDFVPPVYMVAIRYSIAVIVLAVVLNKKLKVLNGSYWLHGIVTGLMLAGGYITQTIGCNFTTAGKNAFLTTVYVILIPLITWSLNKKRPHLAVFVSAIMAVAGVALLSLRNENSSSLSMNIGDALTLVCGLFYALHIVFTSRFTKTENPVIITFLQFLVAAVVSWGIAFLWEGRFPVAVLNNSKVVMSMLYLGIFSSLIAFLLQNVCLKYMESSFASLFLSLESVFGVLFSAVFLHEKMTPVMIAGCVLIFLAITIAEQFNREEK